MATQGGDDNVNGLDIDVAILAIGDFQIFRRFFKIILGIYT